MDLRRADQLLEAAIAGAEVGATGEAIAAGVGIDWTAARDRGWPLRRIGGDRPALAAQLRLLHRCVLLAGGRFDGAMFARELARFGDGTDRALEPAMQLALADLGDGVVWWRGGERAFAARAAAGADDDSCEPVVRALPLAAMRADDGAADTAAALQAITTDWAPATVAAAVAAVRLARAAAAGRRPWHDPSWRDLAQLTRWPAGAAADHPLATWRVHAPADPAAIDWERPPLRCLQQAVATLRLADGLPADDAAIEAAAAAWPECAAAPWRLGAVVGGRATAATALAAALAAAAAPAGTRWSAD